MSSPKPPAQFLPTWLPNVLVQSNQYVSPESPSSRSSHSSSCPLPPCRSRCGHLHTVTPPWAPRSPACLHCWYTNRPACSPRPCCSNQGPTCRSTWGPLPARRSSSHNLWGPSVKVRVGIFQTPQSTQQEGAYTRCPWAISSGVTAPGRRQR